MRSKNNLAFAFITFVLLGDLVVELFYGVELLSTRVVFFLLVWVFALVGFFKERERPESFYKDLIKS